MYNLNFLYPLKYNRMVFDDLSREWDKAGRKQRGKHGGRGFFAEAKHEREGLEDRMSFQRS